ncbi:baseplate wedge subunit and tail pin [Vibrio phage vB_VmeM-32]|nr:baseplate wedge subunit and tail pin [Vibrio phage vB_VmeM-32]
MKELINIGNSVDDGTGDHLRLAGRKINNNTQEIYTKLGDGESIFSAGSWQRYSDTNNALELKFGDAYTINTTENSVTVILPKGTVQDYGKVIKLRDVNGSWSQNPVIVSPASGDTVKGNAFPTELWRNFLDAELVYCAPGNWEYASNKLVSGIVANDNTSVIRKEFIAEDGQTDFVDISDIAYNVTATEVYRRGNLLYYGDNIDENTDFGSIPAIESSPIQTTLTLSAVDNWRGYDSTKSMGNITIDSLDGEFIESISTRIDDDTLNVIKFTSGLINENTVCVIEHNNILYFFHYDESSRSYINTEHEAKALFDDANLTIKLYTYNVTKLDGRTIRLVDPCMKGDTVVIVSYVDGIASYRSSYERASLTMYDYDSTDSNITTVNGQRWVGELKNKFTFTLNDFGFLDSVTYNPKSLEVLINGRCLIRGGEADNPAFVCDGAEGNDADTCVSNGGLWVLSGGDYSIIQNEMGMWRDFVINEPLEHGDIVTVRWFNNDIGTLLDWEGEDGIQELGDGRWVQSGDEYERKNNIAYTDPQQPNSKTAVVTSTVVNQSVSNVQDIFDMLYPVGTIYKNAHNPNNPADYMGFGVWVRYAQGRTIVSFNQDNPNDPNFGINNQDLDVNGNPRPVAGGHVGAVSQTLTENNIPQLSSNDFSLIKNDNGDVLIGGCQYDPDEEGPGFKKYSEKKINVREGSTSNSFSVIQPSVTAHVWLRVQ